MNAGIVPLDLKAIRSLLPSHFKLPLDQLSLRFELLHLRQTSTVKDFTADFNKVANRLEKSAQLDLITYYLNGLIEDVSRPVKSQLASQVAVADLQLFIVQALAGALEGTQHSPSMLAAVSGSRTCHYCKQSGHLIKDCPKKKVMKCQWCKEIGHSASYCPSLKSASANKSVNHVYFSTSSTNGSLIILDITINGIRGRVLIDSGASSDFITQEFHSRVATSVLPASLLLIKFADGSTQESKTMTRFTASLGAFNFSCDARIFQSHGTAYDVVLGMPWLTKFNPIINWSTHSITIGNHTITGRKLGSPPGLINVASRHSIQDDDIVLLLNIQADKSSNDSNSSISLPNSSSPSFKPLLEQYSDVFAPKLPTNHSS